MTVVHAHVLLVSVSYWRVVFNCMHISLHVHKYVRVVQAYYYDPYLPEIVMVVPEPDLGDERHDTFCMDCLVLVTVVHVCGLL